MLTNISGINPSAGYQAQPISPVSNPTNASNQAEPRNSSKNEDDDKVSLSQESKQLEQNYRKRKSALEQNHNEERQSLEREYLQQKNRMEREFQQKKQAIEINLYA